jgi:transcription factor E
MLEALGLELDDPTLKILEVLEQKPEVSETDIAEKLDIKINAARKLLYKLSELSIAEYTKRRHKEKKWWYVYFWHLDKQKIYDALLRKKRQELEYKKNLLEKEKKYAFACRKCKYKFTYQAGLEQDFTCPECNNPVQEIKTSRDVKALERDIVELETKISELQTLVEKAIIDSRAKEEAEVKKVAKPKPKKPVKKAKPKPRAKPKPKAKKTVKKAKPKAKPKPKKKPVKAKPKKAVKKKPVKKAKPKKTVKKAKPKAKPKPKKKPVKAKPKKKAPKKKKVEKKKKKEEEEKPKRSLKKALARVLRGKKSN